MIRHGSGPLELTPNYADVTDNWGEWFQAQQDESHGWVSGNFWRNTIKWLTENQLKYRVALIEVKQEPKLAESREPIEFTFHFLPQPRLDHPQEKKTSKIVSS
jgi:hypothetical protein